MKMISLEQELRGNSYPGRGIVIGRSADGTKAVAAYFIMGRSENSRNRVFVEEGQGIRTQAFDPSKLVDPSLIIYAPVRVLGNKTIVTNGDQTDTIYEGMDRQLTFEQALTSREFEPDAPNYTPRISGVMHIENGAFDYDMYILKSNKGNPDSCNRYTFSYGTALAGEGHFIHTYMGDGNPLPSFEGEPKLVAIPDEIDEFTGLLWESLNEENKVSLFVRYINIADGTCETRKINKRGRSTMKELQLKYGCNPNQKPSRIYMNDGSELPIKVLSGKPGYINFLDAFNGWQLVSNLKQATGLAAATSFKHVSPAGAAVGLPLSETLAKIYWVDDMDWKNFSPIACAYARARGADRMSSFGDFISLSDVCDKDTALLIKREVSDGVIAPGYTPEALEILSQKKKGNYNVIQIDPDYVPAPLEHKEVFGVTFEQGRQELAIDDELISNLVTNNKELTEEAKRDMKISLIILKYTQSNSVCFVKDGQAIGVGAGQQSRVHCTRLAGQKADNWWLRQSPQVLNLPFKEGITRAERDNAIDVYMGEEYMDVIGDGNWERSFTEKPAVFTREEKRAWLDQLTGVTLGSDAFFPFADNIERAHKSGVAYIAQPGGSVRDDLVIECCDKYNMVMAFTGIRLFHH